MQQALLFIVKTLFELYIITFVLRFILQAVRADFHNPISQFFVRITNPLVVPVRRLVPSLSGFDTATIVIVLLLQLFLTLVLVNLTCSGNIAFFQLLALTLIRIIYLVLRIYLFVILIYVLMSWISPGTYHPAAALLARVAEPVLRPFRRWIPAIGGFDLSPLFALIAIQALTMLLPIGGIARGLGCFSVTQLM